jgi:putative membrane protein
VPIIYAMKSIHFRHIRSVSILILSLISLASVLPTSAQTTSPTPANTSPGQLDTSALNTVDRKFLTKAAQSDMSEIKTSQLALKSSQNPQLQFAREMIQAHTESSSKLKPIATRLGLELPKSLGTENQALVNQLKTLSGTSFDRAYRKGQTNGHTKTQAVFETELQQGMNTQLKAFANEILPMVSMHLQMAKSLTAMR